MTTQEAEFQVKRFAPAENKHWIDTYTIPIEKGMTVLEGLWYIMQNIDGSLSFRYSCRGAVCGSCAMMINGTITLACKTQVAELLRGTIKIEPIPRFKLLKDLVVDMEVFLGKYRSIKPYLKNDFQHEKEIRQAPNERQRIAGSSTCILCAACHSACPFTGFDEDYLGPATLTAAHRFTFDSRNSQSNVVLSDVNQQKGALGCKTISRCTDVCPREIEPSKRITDLKNLIKEKSYKGEI